MPRTKLPQGSVPLTFRVPRQTKDLWVVRARRDKLSLAEFIRRALDREFKGARGAQLSKPNHEY
jgi:predicted HicB family RNase H-like nuclease